MRSFLLGGLLASAMIVPVLAQSSLPPASATAPAAQSSAAEKLEGARKVGAYARRSRELAEVEKALAREIEVHENVVADDRVIAFQDVLVIRVEDAALAEARVFRNAGAPAVLDDDEIGVFFRAGFPVTVRARRA